MRPPNYPALSLAVGERIRHYRERAGLSMRKLANKTHLTVSAFSHWERGHKSPALQSLYVVAHALGVDVAALLPSPLGDARRVFLQLLELRLVQPRPRVKRCRICRSPDHFGDRCPQNKFRRGTEPVIWHPSARAYLDALD